MKKNNRTCKKNLQVEEPEMKQQVITFKQFLVELIGDERDVEEILQQMEKVDG